MTARKPFIKSFHGKCDLCGVDRGERHKILVETEHYQEPYHFICDKCLKAVRQKGRRQK